jgi:hypothetical protein
MTTFASRRINILCIEFKIVFFTIMLQNPVICQGRLQNPVICQGWQILTCRKQLPNRIISPKGWLGNNPHPLKIINTPVQVPMKASEWSYICVFEISILPLKIHNIQKQWLDVCSININVLPSSKFQIKLKSERTKCTEFVIYLLKSLLTFYCIKMKGILIHLTSLV